MRGVSIFSEISPGRSVLVNRKEGERHLVAGKCVFVGAQYEVLRRAAVCTGRYSQHVNLQRGRNLINTLHMHVIALAVPTREYNNYLLMKH